MLNTFYALLGRMKYIDRWCLMRSSRPENLCEHTLETAYIAHALALLNRQRGGTLEPEKAVLYALYHDCTEILTGDLPTPVKYKNESIKTAYKAVEKEAQTALLSRPAGTHGGGNDPGGLPLPRSTGPILRRRISFQP